MYIQTTWSSYQHLVVDLAIATPFQTSRNIPIHVKNICTISFLCIPHRIMSRHKDYTTLLYQLKTPIDLSETP
jgi:hypothetical protein